MRSRQASGGAFNERGPLSAKRKDIFGAGCGIWETARVDAFVRVLAHTEGTHLRMELSINSP